MMSPVDINLKRAPKCPRCDKEMQLIKSRKHYFWRCFNISVWHHELFGILGQSANFRTKRLVDPVTLEIIPDPNYKPGGRRK